MSPECGFGKLSKKSPQLRQGGVNGTSALNGCCHINFSQLNSVNKQTSGQVQIRLQVLGKTRPYLDVQLTQELWTDFRAMKYSVASDRILGMEVSYNATSETASRCITTALVDTSSPTEDDDNRMFLK
ncbi:hypothetical protein MTO96_043415 [Rhipicephalus appendiculatus]